MWIRAGRATIFLALCHRGSEDAAGGLAALQPRLTVVCKQPSGGGGGASTRQLAEGTVLADKDLPSAMTCASYLKLPPYSRVEVLKERLTYAITEGVASFDLS